MSKDKSENAPPASKWDQLKQATAEAVSADVEENADRVALMELDHESLLDCAMDSAKKAKENWDKYLRSEAEKHNFEQRMRKEIDKAHKYSQDKLIRDLLAVIDSLELAMESLVEHPHLAEGVSLTHKLFLDNLGKHGVAQTNPLHNSFDPNLHEAISMQPSKDFAPGTVLTVVQKGYVMHGRVLRPAMVIVSTEEK